MRAQPSIVPMSSVVRPANDPGAPEPLSYRRVGNSEENVDAADRVATLIAELYQEVQYLQRVLNRSADSFRQGGTSAHLYDPDQTVIQLFGGGPAISPVEVAQTMAINIAELKGLTAGSRQSRKLDLSEQQEQLYAQLGRSKLAERLRFFRTLLTAQLALALGFLLAFSMAWAPDSLAAILRVSDFALIGTAHAALSAGSLTVQELPVEQILKLSLLISIAVVCLFGYVISLYVLFFSQRPAKAQIDLAKFYSGFFTGLLTNLMSRI